MLYSLRVKQSTRKAFKGHHFDILRKKVAQLYTVRRQREVAEGVSKRDSRENYETREENEHVHLKESSCHTWYIY